MGIHYGKGVLVISSDGGKTWQELNCLSFDVMLDKTGGAKGILLSAVGPPAQMEPLGPVTAEEFARAISAHVMLPSVSYEPPKKKKAQWKQSPLSRFSR